MSRIVTSPSTVLRERLAGVGAVRARAADKPGTHLVSDLLVHVGGNWAELPVVDLLWEVRTAINLYGWGRLRKETSEQLTAVVDEFTQEWQREALTVNLFAQELHTYLLTVGTGKGTPARDLTMFRSLADDVIYDPSRTPERLIRDLRDWLNNYLAEGEDDDSVWEDVRAAEQTLDNFLTRWDSR